MLKKHIILFIGFVVCYSTQLHATNFTESFEKLRAPGIGYQESLYEMPSQTELDSCNFNDNRTNLENAGLKAGSKYARMMWQDFEPSDDDFQFGKLDQLIECASKEGKTVDFRVMLSWPGRPSGKPQGLPTWLIEKGINHIDISNGSSNGAYAVPDWNNPTFLAEHKELITALGQRYDNHKDIGSIDIGSVGFYGEWHYDIGDGDRRDDLMPSQSTMKSVVDTYYTAFPNTPKVALEGLFAENDFDSEISEYVKAKTDIAWRADSWGAQFSSAPDYFNNRYDKLHNEIPNAWKTGIVIIEISENGLDDWPGNSNISSLSSSIALAEKWHTSKIHTKHGSVPPSFIPQLLALEKKLGSRLVLNAVTNASTATTGSALDISMNWINKGIAPVYRDFRIAFRLRKSSDNSVVDVAISPKSVKGWLPNETEDFTTAYNISNRIPAGEYILDTAIVYHSDFETKMPIAVKEMMDDKWVSLGNITLETSNDLYASIKKLLSLNISWTNLIN